MNYKSGLCFISLTQMEISSPVKTAVMLIAVKKRDCVSHADQKYTVQLLSPGDDLSTLQARVLFFFFFAVKQCVSVW